MKFFYFTFGFIIGGLFLLSTHSIWNDRFSFKEAPSENELLAHNDHEEEEHIHLSPEETSKLGVSFEKAAPQYLGKAIVTRGKVILPGNHLAHIVPSITGIAVGALKNIGDPVYEGEVIAIIESQEMAELKAEFLAKLKKEELTYTSLVRERNLFDKQIVSENEYLNALLNYEEAKIQRELALQKLKAYNVTDDEIAYFSQEPNPNLRRFEIRSPMNGTVIHRHITLGEFLESTSSIYEIANLNLLWIETTFSLKDLNHIKIGEEVEVYFPYQKEAHKARIIRISPLLEEENLSAIAILALPNEDESVKVGTFGKVVFQEEKFQVPLAVSCSAIQTIDGKPCLFIKNEEALLEKKVIQTGRSDENYVEILSGIEAGADIATGNTFILKAELGKHEAEHEH